MPTRPVEITSLPELRDSLNGTAADLNSQADAVRALATVFNKATTLVAEPALKHLAGLGVDIDRRMPRFSWLPEATWALLNRLDALHYEMKELGDSYALAAHEVKKLIEG